ncbi:hypothetical protein CEXT_90721 [Caerostris extrusa]|uniref:Uncharacterized protein n=1 Tax=Caerostris extrusa TaxID=172846 RepID=A0AAV4PBW6_CAEEX|nr:hypothetical protein CEXT_90721 [Caerostris extrusa]
MRYTLEIERLFALAIDSDPVYKIIFPKHFLVKYKLLPFPIMGSKKEPFLRPRSRKSALLSQNCSPRRGATPSIFPTPSFSAIIFVYFFLFSQETAAVFDAVGS